MEAVVLVIHLMLALALIGLVLIQRSEGGGLGIGGGGGGLGQFAGVRETAGALTRITAVCAAGFFVTSLLLGHMAGSQSMKEGILENYPAEAEALSDGETDKQAGQNERSSNNEETIPVEVPSAPISD